MFKSVIAAGIGILGLCATTAHAKPTFNISYIDDAAGSLAAKGWTSATSTFQTNIKAAFDNWANHLTASTGQVNVEVRPDTSGTTLRAGGTFNTVWCTVTSPASPSRYCSKGAVAVSSNAAAHTGADILITVDPNYVSTWYWFDPTPANRTDETAPSGKTDFVSIIMHEIGHAMGMVSARPDTHNGTAYVTGYGTFGANYTRFDSLTTPSSALNASLVPLALSFTGANAKAANGAVNLPLQNVIYSDYLFTQNFDHIACSSTATAAINKALMSACAVPTDGRRLDFTAYDIALFKDLGLPMN